MNSKQYLLLLNPSFIEMSRKTCFTEMKEEFSMQCVVRMSFVALAAENKTKITFFLCTNFLLFLRHKQEKWMAGELMMVLIVVITIAQLHSTKPKLQFYAGSNLACSMSEICNDENL